MTTFSGRADCPHDVDMFEKECTAAGILVHVARYPDKSTSFPDLDFEIESDAELEALRNCMRKVFDGHIMVQTLRECPLKDNPLTRDADPFEEKRPPLDPPLKFLGEKPKH